MIFEKGDNAGDLRKVVRFAAESMNRCVRFPFRSEEGFPDVLLGGAEASRQAAEG